MYLSINNLFASHFRQGSNIDSSIKVLEQARQNIKNFKIPNKPKKPSVNQIENQPKTSTKEIPFG